MKNKVFIVTTILAVISFSAKGSVQVIDAIDSGTVLKGISGTVVTDFLQIQYGSEIYGARVFLEYDISGLSLAADDIVTLDIVGLRNFDYDDPAGIIDVYSYYGDGEVTVDDFDAGTYLSSFEAAGEMVPIDLGWMITYDYYTDISIDVTALILDAINAGESYIGFRLSTLTSDRYDLGANLLPIPVLTIVPEPGTVVLMLGGILLAKRKLA